MASFLRHSGSASTLLLRLIAKPVNVQKFSTSSFSSSSYSAAALTLMHMKKNQPTLVSSPSSSSFSLFSNPHHLSNLNSNSQQLAERKRFYAIRADLKEHLDKVIKDNKLVLFMKGTPNEPRCGFSRAVVQILGINGVDVSAIKSFNVLDDEELRTSIKEYSNQIDNKNWTSSLRRLPYKTSLLPLPYKASSTSSLQNFFLIKLLFYLFLIKLLFYLFLTKLLFYLFLTHIYIFFIHIFLLILLLPLLQRLAHDSSSVYRGRVCGRVRHYDSAPSKR